MRKELLPEWARKYKTRGYDVRLKNGKYVLYRVSSVRVEGKRNPQPVQEYVGIITEADGLLEKKRKPSECRGETLEYGLSHFIYSNYRRALQRSLFNVSGERATNIIVLGIVRFIYGSVDADYLGLSYISRGRRDELLAVYENTDKRRVAAVSNKIEALLRKAFPAEGDYRLLVASLRQTTVAVAKGGTGPFPSYPGAAVGVLERCGAEYE